MGVISREVIMRPVFVRPWSPIAAVGWIAAVMVFALWATPGTAQPRTHVYLFRGLADVYSLGMNTLADELNARGVDATAHSHTDWKPIADKAAANYKAGKEAPIILIGHSLGADAVMEMADYLGDKGVPVALVVPFDGTQSFPVPGNVGRVINFTQRDYAYMRPGTGFHGSLSNVDLSADHSIDHVTIDKSPQLHARVISEVLAIVGGRRNATPASAKRVPAGASGAGASPGDGPTRSNETVKPAPESAAPTGSPPPPPQKPAVAPQPVSPAQIPD
jgi:alpha-beta hydrolase superfamily lysophospholipase